MIERLEHTGDSANIAFYRETPRGPTYVWVEVLRSVPMRRGASGAIELVPDAPVDYRASIYRIGRGKIAEAKATRPADAAPYCLEPDEVLEIVRGAIA